MTINYNEFLVLTASFTPLGCPNPLSYGSSLITALITGKINGGPCNAFIIQVNISIKIHLSYWNVLM